MRSQSPKFHIYSAKCPHCGTQDTKIDIWSGENLKRLLAAGIALGVGYLPGNVPMRCCVCKTRFSTS